MMAIWNKLAGVVAIILIAGCGADQPGVAGPGGPADGPKPEVDFRAVAGTYVRAQSETLGQLFYAWGDTFLTVYEISPTGMLSIKGDSAPATRPSEIGQLKVQDMGAKFSAVVEGGTHLEVTVHKASALPSTLLVKGMGSTEGTGGFRGTFYLVRVNPEFGSRAAQVMNDAQFAVRSRLFQTAWKLKAIEVVDEFDPNVPRQIARVLPNELKSHEVRLRSGIFTLPQALSFQEPFDISSAFASPLLARPRPATTRVTNSDSLPYPLINLTTGLSYNVEGWRRMEAHNWVNLAVRSFASTPVAGKYPSSISDSEIGFTIGKIEMKGNDAIGLTLQLRTTDAHDELRSWLGQTRGTIYFVFERETK